MTVAAAAPSVGTDAINRLPNHVGEPRQFAGEFFAPPPPEIGTVTSAESSWPQGKEPLSPLLRLLGGVGIGAVIVLGFYWADSLDGPSKDQTVMILGWLVALAAVAVQMYATRFKATCSYVGPLGVARCNIRGSLRSTPKISTLFFATASELRAKQTRQYMNGVYTGTIYDYGWFDATLRRIYRLNGTYREKKKKPIAEGNPWRFAAAAEVAWSRYYLAIAERDLTAEGSIPFPVDKSRLVRVGPGFLEFHFGEGPVRLTRDNIASVSLAQGRFSFKHKDAKWYGSAGKYAFQYGTMANARVFLLALDKLMGYRWN